MPTRVEVSGFFDSKRNTTVLALALGVIGGLLTAIGFGIESLPVLVIGVVVVASSGAVWMIQGIREDRPPG